MKSVSNNSFTPYINGAVLSSDKSKIYVVTPFGKVSGTSNNSNYTFTFDLNIYFVIVKWVLKETVTDFKNVVNKIQFLLESKWKNYFVKHI